MFHPTRSVAIALFCLQIAACTATQAGQQITVAALAEQIEQGNAPLILDVRSPEEYAEGHIPGAINIPFRDIPNQTDTIGASNRDDIIVYCERGIRAGVAENLLLDAGFVSVMSLTGDIVAWRAAGLPLSQ